MAISAVTGSSTPITATTTVAIAPSQQTDMMMSTQQYVQQYFADIPIMEHIAECESTDRQLDPDGNVHRGKIDPEDVGVMQINEHYNLAQAEKEGYDIYTLAGNVAFARELYEEKGTQPWNSSKPCWGQYQTQNAGASDLAMDTK